MASNEQFPLLGRFRRRQQQAEDTSAARPTRAKGLLGELACLVPTALVPALVVWLLWHEGIGIIEGTLDYGPPVPLLRQPPAVISRDGRLEATLVVEPARVSFANGVSLVVRTYNSTFPGPTFYVYPGDTFELTVINDLGPEADENGTRPSGTMRHPNTTAVHWHGSHLDPVREDNVFKTLHPGGRATYAYRVPTDHPAGTFYVHPHYHGSSAYQAGYAMLSTVVVRERKEDGDRGPRGLTDPSHGLGGSSEAAVTERSERRRETEDLVMVVSQVDVRYPSKARSSLPVDANLIGDRMPTGLVNPNNVTKFLAVNGQDGSTLVAEPGRLYRWRIVNAVMDGYLRLHLRPVRGDREENEEGPCRIAEIAADGVPYRSKRVFERGSQVVIPPGSRRDLIVQCLADAEVHSGHSSKPSEDDVVLFMGNETAVATGLLFHVKVKLGEHYGGHLSHYASSFDAFDSYEPRPTAQRLYPPEPMADLRNASVLEENRRTIRYTQAGPSTPREGRADGNAYPFLGFDGMLFAEHEPLILPRDEVIELTVVNDVCLDGTPAYESHPIHLHTNHFQVVGVSSPLGTDYSPDFRLGDWRDTVAVPAPGSVTLRFVARDFGGDTLLHCHTLVHEDVGMQMLVRIV